MKVTEFSEAEILATLDEGIREFVRVLREGGVETFESCEGGEGHAYLEPTVRFHGGPGAGFAAYAVARAHDLPVWDLRRIWREIDGELTGPHWELTFTRKAGGPLPAVAAP